MPSPAPARAIDPHDATLANQRTLELFKSALV